MAGEFTLVELSKIETDTLRKSVIDTLLMESDVMQAIPWETIGQLATTIVRMGSLPSVGFRKINEGYAKSTGALEQVVENIYLLGGYFDTDKAIARAKNTIADARAIVQVMMTKAIAYKFNDKFINGDPTTLTVATGDLTYPDEFNGLKKRVDYLYEKGYTGQYIDLGSTTGAARADGILYEDAERYRFLDKLDELIYSIKGHNPDFIFMNSKTLLAIRSLLRALKLLDNSKDMFDRVIDIYQGTRLVDIGVKADQTTEVIDFTEDPAGAFTLNTSCSIYAAKFGIGEFMWGIQEYPLEVTDKGLLEGSPIYRTELDWPMGLAMADPYSISRMYNIWPDSTVAS